MTKLLNPDFRNSKLNRRGRSKYRNMEIRGYAEHVVGTHVAGRDPSLKDDATKSYGYEPIDFMCAVMKDGTVDSKMFEFKQINHCLKFEGRDAAVDAAECILLEWTDEDSNIKNFNIDAIKANNNMLELEYRKRLRNEEIAKLEAEEKTEKENKDGTHA